MNTALDVLTCEVRPGPADRGHKAHPEICSPPTHFSAEMFQDGTGTCLGGQQGITPMLHALHALRSHAQMLPVQFCAAKLHLPLPPSLSAEDVAQVLPAHLAIAPAFLVAASVSLPACERSDVMNSCGHTLQSCPPFRIIAYTTHADW